jgi:hypothetical protein
MISSGSTGGNFISGGTGGSMNGTTFVPLHFIVYWYNHVHHRMITVTVSLPSGLTGTGTVGTLADKIQPVVSVCGMFLKVRLQWPSVLYNTNVIGGGWATDQKLTINCKGRMLYETETTIKKLRKASGISSHGNMHGDTKFKLDFEVERDLYRHKVIQDENDGTILQVILIEAKKEEDDTSHDMDVVRVASSKPTSSGFDLTSLTQKNKQKQPPSDSFGYIECGNSSDEAIND